MSDSYFLGSDGQHELHVKDVGLQYTGNGYAMSNESHVIPTADLIEHQADQDCTCGPRSEMVPRADGSIGWLYVHHSLDGREKDEAQ